MPISPAVVTTVNRATEENTGFANQLITLLDRVTSDRLFADTFKQVLLGVDKCEFDYFDVNDYNEARDLRNTEDGTNSEEDDWYDAAENSRENAVGNLDTVTFHGV